VATKESDKEIEEIEHDLAAISEIDEAARLLILRARRAEDLEELKRIREALYRIWLRATARRARAGRHLRPTTATTTRTHAQLYKRQAGSCLRSRRPP
jgi:hypothetical protein